MPNEPSDPNAYPRGGQVAVLCEGDVVGYEAKLLKQWSDAIRPGDRLVDVWPCGTSEALFGVVSAIGRTVRCVVVEDRDFRDLSEAHEACAEMKRDRLAFGLAVLDWRSWRRNEIENYFLDDDVLMPVMTAAFGCEVDEVQEAVAKAIRLLVPLQAMQAAFQKTRLAWKKTDPRMLLGPTRPRWKQHGAEGVDPDKVVLDVKDRLIQWQAKVLRDDGLDEPWKGEALIEDFRRLVAAWNALEIGSQVWREEWAGKELLKLVRQQLCALRPGWWSRNPEKPEPVAWHTMKNNFERDDHDRKIERALLPKFVDRLCQVLLDPSHDAHKDEFGELARSLSS